MHRRTELLAAFSAELPTPEEIAGADFVTGTPPTVSEALAAAAAAPAGPGEANGSRRRSPSPPAKAALEPMPPPTIEPEQPQFAPSLEPVPESLAERSPSAEALGPPIPATPGPVGILGAPATPASASTLPTAEIAEQPAESKPVSEAPAEHLCQLHAVGGSRLGMVREADSAASRSGLHGQLAEQQLAPTSPTTPAAAAHALNMHSPQFAAAPPSPPAPLGGSAGSPAAQLPAVCSAAQRPCAGPAASSEFFVSGLHRPAQHSTYLRGAQRLCLFSAVQLHMHAAVSDCVCTAMPPMLRRSLRAHSSCATTCMHPKSAWRCA